MLSRLSLEQVKWYSGIAFIIATVFAASAGAIHQYVGFRIDRKKAAEEREEKALAATSGRLGKQPTRLFAEGRFFYPFAVGDAHFNIMSGTFRPVDALEVFGLDRFGRFAQDNGLLLEDVGGQLVVSMTVRSRDGRIVGRMIRNEWEVYSGKPQQRNYSENAVEILDEFGDVVFQARLEGGEIHLQAKFYDRDGNGLMIYEEPDRFVPGRKGMAVEFTGNDRPELKGTIKPLFRYPSELHLGQYADTQ